MTFPITARWRTLGYIVIVYGVCHNIILLNSRHDFEPSTLLGNANAYMRNIWIFALLRRSYFQYILVASCENRSMETEVAYPIRRVQSFWPATCHNQKSSRLFDCNYPESTISDLHNHLLMMNGQHSREVAHQWKSLR